MEQGLTFPSYHCANCGASLVWGINNWQTCCPHQSPEMDTVHYRNGGARWDKPICNTETWNNVTDNPRFVTCPKCIAARSAQPNTDKFARDLYKSLFGE